MHGSLALRCIFLRTTTKTENKMPLPTVNEGESRRDFADRCMIDTEMNTKFPNDAQRLDAIKDIFEDVLTDELVSEFNKFSEE